MASQLASRRSLGAEYGMFASWQTVRDSLSVNMDDVLAMAPQLASRRSLSVNMDDVPRHGTTVSQQETTIC